MTGADDALPHPPADGTDRTAPGTSGAAPGDGGWFGRWATDESGSPRFELEPDRRAKVVPDGGLSRCWHPVGNGGLTATAHADGTTTLYATAAGVVRLTGPASSWGLVDAGTTATGAPRPRVPVRPRRTAWGPGYAEWHLDTRGHSIRRRISIAPGARPVLRIDVNIDRPTSNGPIDRRGAGPAQGGAGRGLAYEERWVTEPLVLLVGSLMSRYVAPPADYRGRDAAVWRALYSASHLVRAVTDGARRAISIGCMRPPEPRPEWAAVVHPPRFPVPDMTSEVGPAWLDRSLPHLVVAHLAPVGDEPGQGAGGADQAAEVEGPALRVPLDNPEEQGDGPGGQHQPRRLAFAVALADRLSDVPELLTEARALDPTASARRWTDSCRVHVPDAPWLERETSWHAANLLAARQPDRFFDVAYVSQGSAYGFVHGLQGAPRDYALYAVPLSLVDPPAARDLLTLMMRMTRPSGGMHYAHTGRGRCTSGGVHESPTDLPIFLLWAITEYVWATGDRDFLDVPVPFAPSRRATTAAAATPRERLLLAWCYLRDRIGTGPHDLLRVGSGDWADPISAMVPDRRAFHERGESGFNTAFAVHALPRAALLLADDHPVDAAEMQAFAADLRRAAEATFTGRWFLRGYDGLGGPVGEDHLFLDGQVWSLIAGIGTDEQRRRLVESIAELVDDPSPIGATILDRPHPVRFGMLAPGWDCNGGVWAAINGLLAWGYARHDPALAWRSLRKQSLAAHAEAYPHVWYGVWSGPDAYNAWFGERPGETFVQPATPMTEYPIMNANAHAGPLLGLLHVLGIETGPDGLEVHHPGAPVPDWQLRTPAVRLSGHAPRPVAR